MDQEFERLSLQIHNNSHHHDNHEKSSSPRHSSGRDATKTTSLRLDDTFKLIRQSPKINSISDSLSIRSLSPLASPLSSSYSDLQYLIRRSRSPGRLDDQYQGEPSSGACSTFVNEDDDAPVVIGYSDLDDKMKVHDIEHIASDAMDCDSSYDTLPARQTTPECVGNVGFDLTSAGQSSPSAESRPSKWDDASSFSDDYSFEDAEQILDFTLQLIYGLDSHDHTVSPGQSLRIVHKFIRQLSQHVWQAAPEDQPSNTDPTSGSCSETHNVKGSPPQRGGKRKSNVMNGNRQSDDNGHDCSDGDGDGDGDSYVPVKRVKPTPRDEENLRLSCPFRKRNPYRFNVRDHHSCAMTFFPKFAELRQHIVKQHKRDDPSAFVCDRCNQDFITRKELRDHQRLPREQICEITNVDAESGIDGPTANKLLSRKRIGGSCPMIQWREIWNILFPDDDDDAVQDYRFIPVIEHFELSRGYLNSLEGLKLSLADKMSNPNTLETLTTKFHHCFLETMERCIAEAQELPYANRSNKRHEQLASLSNRCSRSKAQQTLSSSFQPDSGVALTLLDDGSEEGSSVMGGTLTHKNSQTTVVEQVSRGQNNAAATTSSSNDDIGASVVMAQPTIHSPSDVFNDAAFVPHVSHSFLQPTDLFNAWTTAIAFTHGPDPVIEGSLNPVGTSTEFTLHQDPAASLTQPFYPNIPFGGAGEGLASLDRR